MAPLFTPERQAFREAVAAIAEKARATLPECNGRVEKAVCLVLNGDVALLPDGTAQVYSQSNGITSYAVVNGHCDCSDSPRAPHGFCKHRLAAALARRAQAVLTPQADTTPAPQSTPVETEPTTEPPTLPAGIDLQHVAYLHGKPFVKYAGLLAMAHNQGLVSLKVRFVSVTADLALAEAEAVFADGRTHSEAADSTPGNVPPHIRPHFPRMALTRAKARALRDALCISMTALEELEGGEA